MFGITYPNRQRHFANHVARICADYATTQVLGMAVGFIAVINQKLGDAFITSVGNRAPGGRPGDQALLELDTLRLGLVFCETDPGDLWVDVGHAEDDAGDECGGAKRTL